MLVRIAKGLAAAVIIGELCVVAENIGKVIKTAAGIKTEGSIWDIDFKVEKVTESKEG